MLVNVSLMNKQSENKAFLGPQFVLKFVHVKASVLFSGEYEAWVGDSIPFQSPVGLFQVSRWIKSKGEKRRKKNRGESRDGDRGEAVKMETVRESRVKETKTCLSSLCSCFPRSCVFILLVRGHVSGQGELILTPWLEGTFNHGAFGYLFNSTENHRALLLACKWDRNKCPITSGAPCPKVLNTLPVSAPILAASKLPPAPP